MEVLHAIFHRRLVWPDLIETLQHQGAPTGIHAQRDLVVFLRRFSVRSLLGGDELALEQHDFFGVIELDHVGGRLRPARNQVRYHQHVRIPLDHDVRVEGEPDRAVSRHPIVEARLAVLQHFRMPLAIGFTARARQGVVDAHGLHRVALAVLPGEVVAGDEAAESGMERGDVIVLKVDLDEGLPVVRALVDFDPVQHVAVEVEVGGHAEAAQVGGDIALTGEQQPVPALQRPFVQVEAGFVAEVRRPQQLAFEIVGPAMQRAYDVLPVAAPAEHDRLAMPAYVRQ